MKIREKSAMTLVELMAAAGMMVIILSAAGSLYLTGASLYRRVMESQQVYQSAQRVLHLMERDLRNAAYWEFTGVEFDGRGKRVSFASVIPEYSETANTRTERPAGVEYELRGRTLTRSVKSGPAMAVKKQRAQREPLLEGVEELSLRYAGVRSGRTKLVWRPDWVQSRFRRGLPTAVRIELRMEGFPAKQILTKIVSIPAGDVTGEEEDDAP